MVAISSFFVYPSPLVLSTTATERILTIEWDADMDAAMIFRIYNNVGGIVFQENINKGSFPAGMFGYGSYLLYWDNSFGTGIFFARLYEGATQRASTSFLVSP